MVHRRELSAIGAGEMLLLRLHSGGANVAIAIRGHFRGRGTSVETAVTAVIADAADVAFVDHRAVVDVVNVGDVYVIHRAVVEEMIVIPVAALVAEAAIAEAVVHAAVKADVRAPVTDVPEITAAAPTPVARSPQETDLGRQDPDARNPVIAASRVGPIAGSPNVSVSGADGLSVNGEWRRSDTNGNANAETRRSRRHGGRDGEGNQR